MRTCRRIGSRGSSGIEKKIDSEKIIIGDQHWMNGAFVAIKTLAGISDGVVGIKGI